MKQNKKKQPSKLQLSDQRKKLLVGTIAGLALIGGGGWAYFNFTTIAPPPLREAAAPQQVQDVVAYLGNDRGFGRMTVDQQEQYLVQVYQTFNQQPTARSQFIQSLRQMSSAERQVLNDAVFNITRGKVMQHAQEYANLPPSQRPRYIDKAVQQMQKMRDQIGGANSADSLSDPLKNDLPTRPEEVMKLVYSKTSPTERAKAMPFIDAMSARYKEQKTSQH